MTGGGVICIFIENKICYAAIFYDFSDWNKLLVLRIYKNRDPVLTTQVWKQTTYVYVHSNV